MNNNLHGCLELTRWRWHIVAGMLATQAALLAWSAARHSPTIDEPAHLAAGVLAWDSARFDFYRVNPPLVRLIGAMPVMMSMPDTTWGLVGGDLPGERFEWSEGSHFLRRNAPLSRWYLVWARWTVIPLILLGGYICDRWAMELYGSAAGLVALTLWCFCPNVLGHGALMTSDAGAASTGVLAGYSFWCWLRNPSHANQWLAGVTLGVALLTKLTWVILLPLWLALWAANKVLSRRTDPMRAAAAAFYPFGGILLILVTSVFVLNAGYGFSNTLQRLDRFQFVSESLADAGNAARLQKRSELNCIQLTAGNRFSNTWWGAVRVPLPRDYLIGFDQQRFDFESLGMTSYLRGKHQYGGWWYWYLYALAIKVPLGTWCLGGMALFWLRRRSGRSGWWGDIFVATPAIAIVVLASGQTGYTSHLRYVLPAFPFAFIWASQAASTARLPVEHTAVAGGLLWAVLSSLAIYPHSLSYFNEAAGGPERGADHLLDSNIDWGQDLYYLKEWAENHPDARPLFVDCFSPVHPAEIGVDAYPSLAGPSGQPGAVSRESFDDLNWPQPGWHAISICRLFSQADEYAAFRDMTPIDRIGYSIKVFHVSVEDVLRIRRDYGLHDLPTGKGKRRDAPFNN